MASRSLTSGEIALAQAIFGTTTIDFGSVLVHDDKSNPFQPDNVATTPNGEMYFGGLYESDFSLATPSEKALFIHEMTHVLQYQNGMNVVLQRIVDGANYDYDPIF